MKVIATAVNGLFTAEEWYSQDAARHGPIPSRSASCACLLRSPAEGYPDGNQASAQGGPAGRCRHLLG